MKSGWMLLFLFQLQAMASCRYYIDFEGGVNGQAVSLAALTNSLHGPPGTFNYFSSWDGSATNGDGYNFTTAAQHNNFGPISIGDCGNIAVGGSLGMVSSTTYGGQCYRFDPTNTSSSASIGCWLKTDMQVPITNGAPYFSFDVLDLMQLDAQDYLTVNIQNNGNDLRVVMECKGNGTNSSNLAGLTTNAWYWFSLAWNPGNSGTNEMRIYDANTNLVGSRISIYAHTNDMAFIKLGIFNKPQAYDGYHTWIDNIVLDMGPAPEWPLLPTGSAPHSNIMTGGTVLRSAVLQ